MLPHRENHLKQICNFIYSCNKIQILYHPKVQEIFVLLDQVFPESNAEHNEKIRDHIYSFINTKDR
jgi:hypothetical protein